MAVSYTKQRIRLAFDATSRKPIKDKTTGETPFIWRGNDVVFEFAGFYGNPLLSGVQLIDVTNVSSLSLHVKPYNDRDGDPLMTKTVDATAINPSLAVADWLVDTDQHASVTFLKTETALDLGTENEVNYWLVVKAVLLSGAEITWGATTLTVIEDGTNAGTSPTPAPPTSYTKEESDARYMLASANGARIPITEGVNAGKYLLAYAVPTADGQDYLLRITQDPLP